MSSHSGTLGRARGLTIGEQLRRQLSVEWQRDRGYSSSDDDERFVPSIDTTLLASLIAQNQFSTNEVAYRSDCDINELGAREIPPSATNPFPILEQTTNTHNGSSNTIQTNVSPLQLRQGSPFPMDSGNRRMHFNTQERMRSNSNINGEAMFSSRSGLSDLNGSKTHIMPNNSLLRTNRSISSRHNRSSGMTSSSSATSSNSNNNITDRERDNSCRDLESRSQHSNQQRTKEFSSDDKKLELRDTLRLNLDKPNDEPPPEPAPPEVPPRGQSLHATSFHRLDHQLKIEKNGDQTHEHFIPQEQQHEYLMSGSPRTTTGYPARSPLTTSTSCGQQNQQQRMNYNYYGVCLHCWIYGMLNIQSFESR